MERILALSPHLDDAVLSAGASFAALVLNGVRVEICTLFAGTPQPPLSPVARAFHADCGLRDDAMSVRRQEDVVAMAAIGAAPYHLDFLEALYRRDAEGGWLCRYDGAVFDAALPREEALMTALASRIGDLCAISQPQQLLTCAGVGGHVDHRLTRDATLLAASAAGLPVVLWEDLPYGVGSQIAEVSGDRAVIPLPPAAWERKQYAIICYLSQVRMLWPVGFDWWRQLDEHARSRGWGRATELLWKVHPAR
jgi:LmbE family N-acetylglucosaminyl deacetylase